MDNLKKVEKLMERADVSYEEAKAVLEECGWDVLEAVVKLESQGKLKKTPLPHLTPPTAAPADRTPKARRKWQKAMRIIPKAMRTRSAVLFTHCGKQ